MFRNERFRLVLFFLFLLGSHSLYAQCDVVPAGGGGYSSQGTIDVSYGQVICSYATDNTDEHYHSEGVQNPYIPFCPDTVLKGSETLTVCDSLIWHGTIFYTDTVAYHSMVTSLGCDSVSTLFLTVKHTTITYQEMQAAYHFTYNGETYDHSGTFPIATEENNSQGCDSIVMLRLSLLRNAPLPVIYSYDDRFVMVDHYPQGENGDYVDYGSYRWFHDGQLMPLATKDNYYVLRSSGYQKLRGCFYVEVYTGEEDYWVHSNEICISPTKTATVEEPSLQVFPNPANSHQSVTVVLSHVPQGSLLQLYDLSGRLLWVANAQDGETILTLSLSSGVYNVVLRSSDTRIISQRLILR